jgi:hypothetical protein
VFGCLPGTYNWPCVWSGTMQSPCRAALGSLQIDFTLHSPKLGPPARLLMRVQLLQSYLSHALTKEIGRMLCSSCRSSVVEYEQPYVAGMQVCAKNVYLHNGSLRKLLANIAFV